MDLGKGDQIECWSVDIGWLSPITAVVMHTEGEGNKRRFNLQIAETPSRELRAACSHLSSNAGLSGGLCEDECIAGIL